MVATFAGTPSLFLLKSMTRYCRLWPPPWCLAVIRPYAFRPARFLTDRVSDFSGRLRVVSEKSETLDPRRPGVVGLYLRMGIGLRSLRFEDLDGVALGQGDHGPLLIRSLAGGQAGSLDLARAVHRVDVQDPDVPDLLD